MSAVTMDKMTKVYPNGVTAVSDLDLDIADGEFLVLVGPSGCGKSTALRMVAGLEEITDGTLKIGERVVNDLPPKERDIAMVFQNYALYPHMTVEQNIGFALKLARLPKDEITKRVHDAAKTLQLEDWLKRKPAQLSGGQRQRVAMGRAIVRDPSVFLMDEPLSNLDAKLRVQMRAEISNLQRELGITTVYVTHDQVEAMTMGSEVAVFLGGRLQQLAPPRALYDRPGNRFVAGFIGSPPMNLVEAEVVASDDDRGRACEVGGQRLALPGDTVLPEAVDRVVVGLRPESLALALTSTSGDTSEPGRTLSGTVTLVEELGAEEIVHVRLDPSTRLLVRTSGASRLSPGDPATVAVDPTRLHFFDPADGQVIG